ncbi:Hpt domain-containing protein [Legionella tunisiensis]|uniref:Hpt domain-containing protein n=1 Tax=Legionella tunisiensis TaxID=1034944 RepID=UPI0002F9440C|nr:Hpt domain-containing protein [Legionella tunisiensis]
MGTLELDLPDAEDQLFELEQYPLLDIAKGIEGAGSETTLYELLELIINDIPETKKDIQKAYASGDWRSIEALAHKAKDGAIYVGTMRMKYACQYLERYYKTGHSDLLEKLYQQLLRVLDDTQKHLESWLLQRE